MSELLLDPSLRLDRSIRTDTSATDREIRQGALQREYGARHGMVQPRDHRLLFGQRVRLLAEYVSSSSPPWTKLPLTRTPGAGEQADNVLQLLGAMCFAFISKLPNGAVDLKQIKNTPAIFGAIFEFLKDTLSIAPSAYQPFIDWAPTLLAILEDAGVEIWNDHQALETARTEMGSVVEGADKLQAARQKWPLGPMVRRPPPPPHLSDLREDKY